MRQALGTLGVLTGLLVGALPAAAATHHSSTATHHSATHTASTHSYGFGWNCVAYVQAATSFNLMGDAWQWWSAARDVYERGYQPAPGAVMVFSRSGRMHVGHVAVVRSVVGPREILIDQANWHHGQVDHGVSIRDLSPANDWSSVEVEWSKGVYGGPFPITGFVYAPGTPLQEATFHERQAPAHLVEATARTARSGHVVLAGAQGTAAAHKPAAAASGPHHKTAAAQPVASAHAKPVVYRGAKPATGAAGRRKTGESAF